MKDNILLKIRLTSQQRKALNSTQQYSGKPRTTFLASASGNRCDATVDKEFVRPKRVRRGRKPKKDFMDNQSRLCKFFYANVRGFRSKSESINQIIEEHDVDVILLTETKVYTKSAIDIKGF